MVDEFGISDSILNSKGSYNQAKKITGMLNAVKDELHDVPLYYNFSALTNVLHVTTPSMAIFK